MLKIEIVAQWMDRTTSDIRKMVRSGQFPKPRLDPSGIRCWEESDVRRWFNQQVPDIPPKRKRAYFVYFIRCGEYVKIGVSDSPQRRMDDLQTANPLPLEMLCTTEGSYSMERALHERFKRYRVRPNGEWFQLSEEIKAYIKEVRREPAMD